MRDRRVAPPRADRGTDAKAAAATLAALRVSWTPRTSVFALVDWTTKSQGTLRGPSPPAGRFTSSWPTRTPAQVHRRASPSSDAVRIVRGFSMICNDVTSTSSWAWKTARSQESRSDAPATFAIATLAAMSRAGFDDA